MSLGELRTITGAGARLAVWERGDPRGPAVVLAHGLTGTSEYVVMGCRRLERTGHRVIAYDARGHGASGAPAAPDEYGYPWLERDLQAVLDGLAVERAVLAGISMGAVTALRLAAHRPERVAGVLAITPGYDPDASTQLRARWRALAAAYHGGGVDGFLDAYAASRPDAPWLRDVRTLVRRRFELHRDPAALADALAMIPASRGFDSFDELAAIRCPVTVVASHDTWDPEHPYALAERYAAALGVEPRCEAPGDRALSTSGRALAALIAELVRRAGGLDATPVARARRLSLDPPRMG
jgi:pimeloyl-ACP methyl ester carboxylesterase